MKLTASYNELVGSNICFLMSINWNGNLFYFSSLPIEITKDNGDTIFFNGLLEDPQFKLESSVLGYNVNSNSIPIEIYFDNLNVSKEIFDGNNIEESPCEISYVLIREFNAIVNFEQRIILMDGIIKQPIFGHIDKPVGYCVFSVENESDNQIIQIIKPEKKISYETFIDPNDSTAIGKVYPFIIGSPGHDIPQTVSTGAIFNSDIYCTPAYINNEQNTLGGVFEVLIAGHTVDATRVEIVDFAHNSTSLPIAEITDLQGNKISVLTMNPPMQGNLSTSDNAGNPFYWVRWTTGGGYKNPFGFGALEFAGDLLLFFMMKLNCNVDFSSFDAMRNYLNSYKFCGYINTNITVQQFIQQHMIPFLPIEILNGPKGLRPVLSLIYNNNPQTQFDFVVGENCIINTPIQPSIANDNIINEVTLLYGFSGYFDKYLGYYTCKESEYTTISKNRFGVRKEEIELRFVTDFSTVQKIGSHILRTNAIGYYIIEIITDMQFGYLYLGDIISLTSFNHGIHDIKCQILSKEYNDNSWIYELMVENIK